MNYGTDAVTAQVLSYGIPANKLQVGLAAYGRGFAGVPAGDEVDHPGFEQAWTSSAYFSDEYTKQEGLLPYSSVVKAINNLGYKSYQVMAQDENNNSFVTGAYIYNPQAKQFVGYQSPEAVKAVCEFVKAKQLQGAILWSADTDLPVSNPASLVATYKSGCQ